MVGVEVSTLIDANAPAGNQVVKLHTENLKSGIYFYQLRAGTFTETKKLVVQK